MTPKEGPPTLLDKLEKYIGHDGLAYEDDSCVCGLREVLDALERDEKRRAALEGCANILDSLVGMLSGMAIQDGMPPQAVTLYKNAAIALKQLTPAPEEKA